MTNLNFFDLSVGSFLFMLCWICGIVIAQGFISTFFAIIFIPWSFYLFAEKALTIFGWL